jgi:hypothetical protein
MNATPVIDEDARFSEQLAMLASAFEDRKVKLREVLEVTHGKGHLLLLIILNLPFITPIPIPGLSMLIGIIDVIIGLRLAMSQKPWFPKSVLDIELPPRFFPTLLSVTGKMLKKIEWLVKPRLVILGHGLFNQLNGVLIVIAGALLMLPLPIPFSNGLPAWAIILMAVGMMQKDGYFIMSGYFLFSATIAFFAGLIFGGAKGLEWVWQLIFGG